MEHVQEGRGARAEAGVQAEETQKERRQGSRLMRLRKTFTLVRKHSEGGGTSFNFREGFWASTTVIGLAIGAAKGPIPSLATAP